MDAERDLTQAGDWLRPFPDAAEVFAADQQHLARHLHPLVSIDLAAVDPHWSGWLHLLSPLEPCDGLVGQYSQVEDGELLKPNWIGFQVEADGRYRLLGDARYFLLESSAEQTPAALALSRRDLEKHYAEQEAAYAASREYYRRNGKLVRLDRKGRPSYGDEDAVELVESVGGEVDAGGNWEETVEFPLEYGRPGGADAGDADDVVWPLSPAGRRFRHVASVPGWNYRTSGADTILLFYEPVERLALLSFDWT
ncbi:hypothetical protein SAMN04487939_12556 [Lysobacter sp. yr284]|uniref:hypothetical protein n=1 Tax=Lysobacter sp. yr284 TaxID=1761791 RepID=UPI00089D7B08|nr:hypothetical protein [Lysobacter sp. yr284]SDZ23631.1 hypothetical protein SAMN04487939_12556 [Lysobacter sp. yr284]